MATDHIACKSVNQAPHSLCKNFTLCLPLSHSSRSGGFPPIIPSCFIVLESGALIENILSKEKECVLCSIVLVSSNKKRLSPLFQISSPAMTKTKISIMKCERTMIKFRRRRWLKYLRWRLKTLDRLILHLEL